MLKSVVSKVAWVGRTASMVFGLALVLALLFGVATMALGATGGNFILGKANTAGATSKLTSAVAGPTLQLINNGTAAATTALHLTVPSGKPPMTVNATAGKATNLNADKLDGKDGADLPGTVVQMAPISGATSDAGTLGDPLKFVTPTVTLSTTSTQRLAGVVSVPIRTDTSTALVNYGLCYASAATTTTPLLFYGGSNTVQGEATATTASFTSAQTTVPGAGTWDVGFCARNADNIGVQVKGDGSASGWIEVTN